MASEMPQNLNDPKGVHSQSASVKYFVRPMKWKIAEGEDDTKCYRRPEQLVIKSADGRNLITHKLLC
jgi:hypothetical protein